jgi:hypothetical protein
MSVRVSITGGERIKKALQKIVDTDIYVKAGVLEGATTTDGMSIAAYAYWNEIGTNDGRIPPRPFLRQTVNDKQSSWKAFLDNNVDYNNIERDKCATVMGVLGEIMVADIKATIQRGNFTPNAESTRKAKERRGKSEPGHPLIDTGQLLEHGISSEVVK